MIASHLRCELLTDPVGIDAPEPRLSWELESDRRGARQVAYRLRVATSPEVLADGGADVWDSGDVPSTETAHVRYGGPRLGSGRRVHWLVEVVDEQGGRSASAPASWEVGLLTREEWGATWIRRPVGWPGGDGAPTTLLRREVELRAAPTRARLHVTALGVYEARVNGRRIGDDRLGPGWTDYHHRLQYQVHDVTGLLAAGRNVLGVELADGWYAGHVGFLGRHLYGSHPELLARLVVEHADGPPTVVVSDAAWLAAPSCRRTDQLMGEELDLTGHPVGWDAVDGGAGVRWAPAAVGTGTSVPLVPTLAPPVRVLSTVRPIGRTEPTAGAWVFDLGQNLVGWVRLRADAPAGTRVTLRFAEVLAADGTLYVDNLRTARATDAFVLPGGAVEVEPAFTFHGFRYVEVSGVEAPELDDVVALVCGSDLEPTGTFACSDDVVNRLQSNIVWGQRGNFLEVPTDCPQRDERLGWTGDAQVFGATAAFNQDVSTFLARWLRDLVFGQSADGAFPVVAPRLTGPNPDEADGAPGWGDAGVIVPWLLYERYADRDLLASCFDAMAAWIEHVRRANPDLVWRHGRHGDMGDWLSIDADSPKEVVATAYFAWSARLVARASAVLGLDRAAADAALADAVAAAFRGAFVSEAGDVHGGTQTVHALALRFGLLEPRQRAHVARRLVEDVEARGDHLSTGFLGVAHLLPALTEAGHVDVAYRLLHQDTCPSWGYPVLHGATTIWERWDGWTEERGFADPAMNSFNHYAFGAVGEWLYEHVAGLRGDPAHPGYGRVVLAPKPGGDLTWAAATYRSLRGTISIRWEREEAGGLAVDVTIPPGVEAELHLPTASGRVFEDDRDIVAVEDIEVLDHRDGTLRLALGSGRFRFRAP